jgi:hypothetical protein
MSNRHLGHVSAWAPVPAHIAHRAATRYAAADECLVSTYSTSCGYAQISWVEGGHGRSTTAHRAAWAYHYGPVPIGMTVDHDPPSALMARRCVRRDHLWLRSTGWHRVLDAPAPDSDWITEADPLKALRKYQAGRCAICRRNVELVVDHDHATGLVRGLLCISCNNAEGKAHARDLPGFTAYRMAPPVVAAELSVRYRPARFQRLRST